MTGPTPPDSNSEERQAHERLVLPLVVPALLFLFAVLVVYGLSRIYIDLNTWHYKDVRMATPLAIGIALLILLVSTYLAGRPVPRWQVGMIVVLAASGLTGGAIWAAVHPEGEVKATPPTASATPPSGGTPVAGAIQVALSEFKVEPNPASASAGSVSFNVANGGTIIHNFRVIKTDLDPAKLPIDSTGFAVDETQVEVLASGKELDVGASETVTADLQAGTYVLICNVPSHYQAGMHTAFTVQ